MNRLTLGEMVDRAAARHPDATALVFDGRRFSFSDFHAAVERAARGFLAQGIRKGEPVVLWMSNGPAWLHAFFGLQKVGAVVIPVNTRFRSVDLEYVLRQSDATTLIVRDRSGSADLLDVVRALLPELDGPPARPFARFAQLRRVILSGSVHVPPGARGWDSVLEDGEAVSAEALRTRQASVRPEDCAVILYTSGTTGAPKGAMHSHAMVRTVFDGANRLGITPRDAILLYLPLFHSMGLYLGGLLFLAGGARLVLMERFDAGESLALIERECVTFMPGFDTHFFDMLEHPRFAQTDRLTLRFAMLPAGAAGVEPIARRTNAAFCPTVSGYGSSECGTGIALTFLDAALEERCLGSGYPMPGYEFQTRDPDGGRPNAPGVAGELYVRGYGVMLGYYGKPEETARALDAEGWFRTGDMAVIDAYGFLRYLGRYKDMLKVGGENLDPTEVEGFLEAHPAIAQVKVVGVPHRRLGEVPVACVVPRAGAGLTVEELRDWCHGRIASFKIPLAVVTVESFPMTSTGKVQRGALREAIVAQLEGRPGSN